jgi:hypothetical protein
LLGRIGISPVRATQAARLNLSERQPRLRPETNQPTHLGPYEKLAETYTALANRAATQGLALSGPMWEVYLSDPQLTFILIDAEFDPELTSRVPSLELVP